MKEFLPYLERLGIRTSPLLSRVELLYRLATMVCPEKIEDIYISEYIKDDSTREYESLWFFSKKYCLETHQFINDDNIDIVPLSNLMRVAISAKEYDFKQATSKSRLNVRVQFIMPVEGNLKASGENCDFLNNIILKYFRFI